MVAQSEEMDDLKVQLEKEKKARKTAEENLLLSEVRYNTVIKYVQEIIFQTDAEGNWLFLNEAWTDIMGYSLEESLGTLFLNYVHPDDRQRNMDLFQPLIERKKEYCLHQIRYITKSNKIVWIEVLARLGVDENDQITGTFGTLRDVTESRLISGLENALLELSVQVAATPSDKIDESIRYSLQKMGEFLYADRSYIFEYSPKHTTMSNTYEWCVEGVDAQIDNLQSIPVEVFSMWNSKMESREEIIIPSVKDLPESWKLEKDILEPQGIQSLLVIPLFYDNIVNGFVGLDIVTSQKDFTNSEVNVLKMWGNMLSSLLQRRRNEQLLDQARKNFENFFNANIDMLFVFDEHGVIIQVNDMVCTATGYCREEIVGQEMSLFSGMEHRARAMSELYEILQGKRIFSNVNIQTRDGFAIPAETTYKFGYWNDEKVIYGVSRDVTNIRISEEKFTRAFQSDSVLMFIFSLKDFQFVDVNNAFLNKMGYQRDEIIGKKFSEVNLLKADLLSGKNNEDLKKLFPVQDQEFEFLKKNGGTLTMLLSADMIYVGPELSIIATMVDITNRKKTELALEESIAEAEKANRAKSEFLSRMSHELRTPMNSILGFAQLLDMGDLSGPQKKGVDHILNSGKHLLNLINEVLDIARIEAGKLIIKPEKLNIANLVKESVELVHPLAMDRKVSVEIDADNSAAMNVMADKQRLMQVLINLISNAIKYNSPEGKVTIVIRIIQEGLFDQDSVRVTVIDTGIGIADKDLSRLFNPFERLSHYQVKEEGTGLGLPISRDLMHAMGGKIGVESALGIGSSFWIEMKVSADLIQEKNFKSQQNPGLSSRNDMNGTILYIEDNPTNTELVRQLLKSYRPEIDLVTEIYGERAEDLALQYKPRLMLLDLNLPDLHGSEIIERFQRNKELKDIPVVVITADVLPGQISEMKKKGIKEYLTKPLDVIRLLKIIDIFVKND